MIGSINALNESEIKVVSDPTTAAPTPAIWPSGSMASALKFPNRMPMQKKATAI